MKRLLALPLLLILCLSANAQLKAPRESRRDTLVFTDCHYRGSEVPLRDWPCLFLEETPTRILIAGETYTKCSEPSRDINIYSSSWEGHIDHFSFASNASDKLFKVVTHSDCSYYPILLYGIDDYEFYAFKLIDAKDYDTIYYHAMRAGLTPEQLSDIIDREGLDPDPKTFYDAIKDYEGTPTDEIEMISSSPKWAPGKQQGRDVRVTYTFPVIFSLR